MIKRKRYCSNRMCGATDCATCYGPGYDLEDDETDDNEPEEEDEEDPEDDDDDREEDPGSDFDDVAP